MRASASSYSRPDTRGTTCESQKAWADDGTVRSETTIASAELPDPCRLGPLDVDVTAVLRAAMEERLPALTDRLDSTIEARSLSARRLSAFWDRLARPIELRSRLWLTFSPSAIAGSPLAASAGDAEALESAIRVTIAPRAVKGEQPSERPSPLPRVEVLSAEAAAGGEGAGCHLAIPVAVPYGELNDTLRRQVVGMSFDVGPLGSVRVISTLLYGSGDRLVMEVGVEGAVKGRIYARAHAARRDQPSRVRGAAQPRDRARRDHAGQGRADHAARRLSGGGRHRGPDRIDAALDLAVR